MTERSAVRLTAQTGRGAAWLVGSRLATKALDLVTLLILARLLSPVEFGVVAVAMTLIFIVEAVSELPVNQVLIRIGHLRWQHLDTAFTLGALRGLVLALGLSLIAWPFSYLYNEPRLLVLLPVLSLAPAMRGLINPALAYYSIRLDFRRDFAIEVVGKLAALILSTCAALYFHNFWAVVVGIVSTPTMMVFISYVVLPYKPRLTLSAWAVFASYLKWTTGGQLLAAINWQCDRLVLGYSLPHASLGAFSLANDISYLPEQALVKPILRPLMSAFSLISSDPERLKSAYKKASATVLAIGLPAMLGLSVLAEPAILFALGSKWVAAIPILRWLPLTLIPMLFIAPLPSLALALGRPDIMLKQVAADSATKIPLVILGAVMFGIPGVIAARAVSSCVSAIASFYFLRSLIGTSMLHQIQVAWRILVSGAAMALVLYLIRPFLIDQPGLLLGLLLAVAGGLGMMVYVSSLFALWIFSGRPEGMEAAAFRRLPFAYPRSSKSEVPIGG